MFLGECRSSTGVMHAGKVLKIKPTPTPPFLWIIFALGFYIKPKQSTNPFNKAVKMQAMSSLKPLYIHTSTHAHFFFLANGAVSEHPQWAVGHSFIVFCVPACLHASSSLKVQAAGREALEPHETATVLG